METIHNTRLTMVTGGVSRRTALRGLGGAGMATVLAFAPPHGLRASANSEDRIAKALFGAGASAADMMIEPEAGSWKTWVLSSGDELRPAAPPNEAMTEDELAKLTAMAADRDAAALDRISYWDAGSPGYRWNEIAMQQTAQAGLTVDSYRVMALLNAAIYDATIAAWDAKYTYHRPRPAIANAELSTAIPTPHSPSYPDEHAVTAGAAATVLAYLFPEDAERLTGLATEAAESRVMAGVAYPSDAAAGLTLGQDVGKLFVTYGKADGANGVFDAATMPTGPGLWTGDPGNRPVAGTWKTWVLESGDQFRPEPPPAPDSPQRAAEIAEVKNYERDNAAFKELWFWPQDPAGRPTPDSAPFSSNQAVFAYAPLVHFLWGPELAQKLFEYRWDTNAPRSARAYALVSLANCDATVACIEAKFFYWTARPDQFDSELTTILPTYPTPDYPSLHATGLAATAEVLSYFFPRDEHFFQSRAEENAASRVWAGIHFRSATEAGLQLGRDVGDAVIEWAERDGAD